MHASTAPLPAEEAAPRAPRRWQLLLGLFVINFCSLLLEILWVRRLVFQFGSTAATVSTVFAAFLSGIALGGWLGGRWIGRTRRGAQGTALLGVVLAGYVLVSSWILDAAAFPYLALALGWGELPRLAAKFALSFAVMLVPTTIIGLMYPVFTRWVRPAAPLRGGDVAATYAADTFGAATGALLAGFVVVPSLGLRAGTWIAGACLLLVALWLLRAARRAPHEPMEPPLAAGRERLAAPGAAWLLGACFLSGFAALTFEVVWTRFFQLVFGSSLVAVTIVVTGFMLGVAAGSWGGRGWVDRRSDPVRAFVFVELGIGLFGTLVALAGPSLEALWLWAYARFEFAGFHLLLGLAAFAVILPATFLMGLNFPLAVRMVGRLRGGESRDVGAVFGINTAGGILGSLAAGFVVVPALGAQRSALVGFALYAAIAMALWWRFLRGGPGGRRVVPAALAAVVAVWVVAAAGFGERVSIAVYYHGPRYATWQALEERRASDHLRWSREGHYGQVQVVQSSQGTLYLRLNGKTDASTAASDTPTQLMAAHLPLVFHAAPKRVAVIGLGGGFTLGATTLHADVQRIDLIEIDPLVVEATRRFFGPYTRRALDDGRVDVVVDDARSYALRTRERYDVVTSEPSNLWITGVSALYTEEGYRTLDRLLAPGGIFCQWIPLYEMHTTTMESVVRTARRVFPFVQAWQVGGDMLILVSHRPLVLDETRVRAFLVNGDVLQDLFTAFPGPGPAMFQPFLEAPAVSAARADEILAAAGPVSVDDLPYVEFATYRYRFEVKGQ